MSGARRWFALLAVLGCAGCGALFPKGAASQFFLLTGLEPATAAPHAATPSIVLGPVVLPEYLDRPELVTRLATNQLRVEDLELWAEPLRDSVPRTMQRDLAALLGPGRVQRAPWTSTAPPQAAISVEVVRFEKTAAGTVDLVARWAICTGGGQDQCRRRETRRSYATTSATTQAAVASMSEALATLSREIATDLQRLAADQARAAAQPGGATL